MARTFLTKQQKLALCAHRRTQEPHASLQELCNWAAAIFALPQTPSKTMISRALRQERQLQHLNHDQLQRRRTQPDSVTALDTMLLDAMSFFEAGDVALNGRLIIWLAQRCADRLQIPAASRPRFTRGGWLRHFMRRHGIRSRCAHGEIGSADLAVAKAAVEELRGTIAAYHPDDVYNMDEAAFFYRALVRRSLCVNTAPALKQKKARVTVVVAANASGAHKLPLTVLGTAKKPRWLPNKPADMHYVGTRKGWMTSPIYQQWLEDLNAEMVAAGRRVLLLVDNAPSHKDTDEALSNLRVIRLPPNMTAAIQPMDQGVIAAVKASILNRQTAAIMERFMEGHEDAHNIAIEEALHWCKDAWDSVSTDAIRRCWQHAGLYVNCIRIADILNP